MLKRLLLLSALALAAPAAALAQSPAAAAPTAAEPTADRAAIETAEVEWAAALRGKDQTTLDRLMAPEFHLGGVGDDTVIPRDLWLANLHRMDISVYTVRVTDVRVDGDTAVATVTGDWTVSMGGPAMQDSFEIQDTWVRRDGGWQVVKRYRTDTPSPPPVD